MKKKFFGGIAILAIAAVAVFNLNFKVQNEDLSALSLDSVEALASEGIFDELGKWWNRRDWDCVSTKCGVFLYQDCPKKVEEGTGSEAHSWSCPCC